jgi:hypothetical protein
VRAATTLAFSSSALEAVANQRACLICDSRPPRRGNRARPSRNTRPRCPSPLCADPGQSLVLFIQIEELWIVFRSANNLPKCRKGGDPGLFNSLYMKCNERRASRPPRVMR